MARRVAACCCVSSRDSSRDSGRDTGVGGLLSVVGYVDVPCRGN